MLFLAGNWRGWTKTAGNSFVVVPLYPALKRGAKLGRPSPGLISGAVIRTR
jgi:hypothetical protein